MCGVDGVDSLRGGLAEGNRITPQRLLDQSQAGVYWPYVHLFHPIWVSGPGGGGESPPRDWYTTC